MSESNGGKPRLRKLERLAGRSLNSTTSKTRRALGLNGIEQLMQDDGGDEGDSARRKSERILGSPAAETTTRVRRGLGL